MASFNLEKGLDEIIASTGISAGGRKNRSGAARSFKKNRAAGSTKALSKASAASRTAKAGANGSKQADKVAKAFAAAPSNPLALAKRVVVSNMPLDVNEDAVRQYFSAHIGKVRKVEGNYREDGRPTGTYTITFEKPGKAQQSLEKFHGQPVDGGRTHMSVQISLDATAATPNTSQGRIGVSAASNVAANDAGSAKNRRNRKKKAGSGAAAAPVKAAPAPQPAKAQPAKAEAGKKSAKKNKAKPKPKPSTAADLDAEMSDYFAKADQNEISV